MHKVLDNTNKSVLLFFEFIFATKVMNHYFENAIRLFMIVYILCNQIIGLNSKSSILWKLNEKSGKIDSYSNSHQHLAKEIREIYESDAIFSIIASASGMKDNDNWQKDFDSTCIADYLYAYRATNSYEPMQNASQKRSVAEINLDCGRPVSFSFYDDLIGISSRYSHPIVPDPEATTAFLKTKDQRNLKSVDMDLLEKRLKKAKRDKPWNARLFNQIGNFWRIKGDAGKAIDCFRGALIMDPTNPDVLHDLARVLFMLQYLDDAVFLVRRSLETQSNNRHTWRSFFTLGEIYRAYGQFQQSILYFRQALELNPEHELIQRAIRDMEHTAPSQIQFFTIIIICLLVISVLGVIITTNDFSCCPEPVEQKPQRHFNRAMAMKSLKGFVPRSRSRKA